VYASEVCYRNFSLLLVIIINIYIFLIFKWQYKERKDEKGCPNYVNYYSVNYATTLKIPNYTVSRGIMTVPTHPVK